jgi:alpha-mannosidase
LVITTQFDRIRLKSTITLYAHLDRVDIRNEVHKTVSEERQQLDFAFPFHVPGRQFRLENPGAILDPERDMRPGAGLSAAVVRHFVDVFNAEYGVTMSMADSFSVQFGRRTTTEDPQTVDPSATLLATALGNIYDANEAIRDQAGVEDFVFRFSLRGHAGGFDPAAAVRFGWEDNNALETAHLPGGIGGSMPARHSFVTVEPATAILAGMKVGEEGGTVLRFWETGNLDEGVRLRLALPQALSAAQITDHLERVRETLPIRDGEIVVPLRPRGVTTARFL